MTDEAIGPQRKASTNTQRRTLAFIAAVLGRLSISIASLMRLELRAGRLPNAVGANRVLIGC